MECPYPKLQVYSSLLNKYKDIEPFLLESGSSVELFFFAESRQAKRHLCDVTLHAVGKSGTWVTAGSFQERGGVLC